MLAAEVDAREAALALRGRAGLVWLDGGPTHPAEGRLSYVASDPVEVRVAHFGDGGSPLSLFRDLGSAPTDEKLAVPRWVGWVAYDAAFAGKARSAARLVREPALPVVWLGRYDAVLVWDETEGTARIVGDDEAACRRLARRIEHGQTDAPRAEVGEVRVPDPERHLAAIDRALGHIGEGEIYQVNLARRFTAPFAGDPLALYLAMREASPVPLGFYADAGDHAVLSRTMERFLSWDGPEGTLTSRPIKGTIARAGNDETEAETLRADAKERAEHAMIVDLMRNDLGRIAELGSVEVRRFLDVEPFAGLHHLVSTIVATTRPEVGLREVLLATFPPGSVTGTPKHRAMQVIEALEPRARGIYTGAYGFVDRCGGLSLAVAIRTAVVREGTAHYFAGGGIVEASDPAREVAETELKARVFLDAARRNDG